MQDPPELIISQFSVSHGSVSEMFVETKFLLLLLVKLLLSMCMAYDLANHGLCNRQELERLNEISVHPIQLTTITFGCHFIFPIIRPTFFIYEH